MLENKWFKSLQHANLDWPTDNNPNRLKSFDSICNIANKILGTSYAYTILYCTKRWAMLFCNILRLVCLVNDSNISRHYCDSPNNRHWHDWGIKNWKICDSLIWADFVTNQYTKYSDHRFKAVFINLTNIFK